MLIPHCKGVPIAIGTIEAIPNSNNGMHVGAFLLYALYELDALDVQDCEGCSDLSHQDIISDFYHGDQLFFVLILVHQTETKNEKSITAPFGTVHQPDCLFTKCLL
jgi:hypothetical protein